MLAYIKGVLEQVTDQGVVVDNHGLGYWVNMSAATISRLPPRGGEIKLFTYMQVKEDGIALHGFLTQEEVRLFTLLISVSGIGPKVATAVLAAMSPSQLILAIVADDAAALSKAPGVGKKTAQRIALELRDKMKTAGVGTEGEGLTATGALIQTGGAKQDALEALLALGYGRGEALKAVMETAQDDMTAERIIRESLKRLM